MFLKKKPSRNPNTPSSSKSKRISAAILAALVANFLTVTPSFAQNTQRPDGNKKNVPELNTKKLTEKNTIINHQEIITMNVDDILKMYPYNGIEIIREHMLIEINKLRQANGKSLLKQNKILNSVAEDYAKYLYDNNYFSHTDKDGLEIDDRIKKGGGNFIFVGENLGRGQKSIQKVLDRRYNYSATHKETMLLYRYTDIGIGYYNGYRVVKFGQK